jgi:hypothetical protein
MKTPAPNPIPGERNHRFSPFPRSAFERYFLLIFCCAIALSGCAKHQPVSSEPTPEPTEEERLLCANTWFADSMQVNGESAILYYNRFVRGNDTALVDFNYVGCTFSFLLNYKVWFRSVTTIPWLGYSYPEKALEDWSLKNGALSIGFPYARPLQEGAWNIDGRTQTALTLTRKAGIDTITIFCSAGDTPADWTLQMNARLSKLLYKTWTLISCDKHVLVLADSLVSFHFSDFTNGVGFAEVRYRNGISARDVSHAGMNASMFDDIPEIGLHLKYTPLPEATYTYFYIVFLGDRRMELLEEATNTRFIFSATP